MQSWVRWRRVSGTAFQMITKLSRWVSADSFRCLRPSASAQLLLSLVNGGYRRLHGVVDDEDRARLSNVITNFAL